MKPIITIRLTRIRLVCALVAALVVMGGTIAVAQTAILTGKGVTQVKVSPFAVSDLVTTDPQDLPGVAPLTVTVPANQQALVKLTLSSETTCQGGPDDFCRVSFQFRKGNGPRTVINNIVWDSNDSDFSGITKEAHTITKTVGPLTSGTYTFFVQGDLQIDATRLLLQQGEFLAERIAV